MSETWKDIVGYEGMYQVSDQGRVKSLTRIDNIKHIKPGKILKPQLTRNGYRYVNLSKNGIAKKHLVHRLVAQAFLNKPIGCEVINHLDNDRQNNRAENLEWTTPKGNMQWATRQGRMKCGEQARNNLRRASQNRKKPVVAIDEAGNKYYFSSQTEAAEILGISGRGHIAAACRKSYGNKTVGGYRWEYALKNKQR